MRRGRVIALTVAALGLGLLPMHVHAGAPTSTPAHITNIGVGVSGGVATYYVCVMAPWQPAAGGVTVSGPKGDQQAPLQYSNQTCGPSSYLMQASFPPLPPGSYQFKVACVLMGPDRSGKPGPLVPCLVRNVGFASNFQGATIATGCQVDFDPRRTMAPQNCSAPGVQGNIATTSAAPSVPTTKASSVATKTPPPPAVPWIGPAASRALFAEGYTGAGYQEYLSLLNPDTQALDAQVTIYRADGATRIVPVRLAALTRNTLNINMLAPQASTALRVTAAQGPVVAERALYLSGGSGHIVAGTALPARRWYVAEGYVGKGFADALRVFNPYDPPATLTITAYRASGAARLAHRTVPGGTRLNIALDDVAPHGASALMVESSEPVVVESIVHTANSSGSSAAMAIPAPARAWYFPDGGTLPGNQEYIALFNPGTAPATVRLQPVTGRGFERLIATRVAPHARAVIAVHDYLRRTGLAAVLRADRPVVAQEVRYADGGGISLVDGATQPAYSWALAEGYAGAGFNEWIALLNPGDRGTAVRVRLIGQKGPITTVTVHEQAKHVEYLYVNNLVPRGSSVSALIEANRPIVAGRTLTFNGNRGLSTTTAMSLSNNG